jgi:hypothetical protein
MASNPSALGAWQSVHPALCADWFSTVVPPDGRITVGDSAALEMAVRRTSAGLPFLTPEIQLLYKAKDPRPRDQADFDLIAPQLDRGARAWLRDVLARLDSGHAWVHELLTL